MKILRIKARNINSLKGDISIDFQEMLREDALFAITGPTGSGKSTILDIITCALYDRTPRLKNPEELMSRHTGESLCEVEFEIKGKTYRSTWSQRRARNRPDGKIQTAKMEIADVATGKILKSKLRDVPKFVEEISGLDFDRFKQSMMLAQGGFDAFLKANENERSQLLEKITGTQIYAQISKEIYETYTTQKRAIELEESSLGAIELLDDETLKEKSSQLTTHTTQKQALDKEENSLKEIASWLSEIEKIQADEQKYNEEFTEASKNKEQSAERFVKLERANKALGIESLYNQKNSLTKTIEEQKIELKRLTKELQRDETEQKSQNTQFAKLQSELQIEKSNYALANDNIKYIRAINTKIDSHNVRLKEINNELATITKKIDDTKRELQANLTKRSTLEEALAKTESYLHEYKKYASIKENLPIISKIINDYKGFWEKLEQSKKSYTSSQQIEQKLTQELTTIQEQVTQLTASHSTIVEKYQALENSTQEYNKKEQQKRERLHVVEELRKAVDHTLESQATLASEETNLTQIANGKSLLKQNIEEKKSLTQEIEKHINTLRTQKDMELLLSKYESDRAKLKEGEACYLCGATEHPYIADIPIIDIDETDAKIELKTKKLSEQNEKLKTLEIENGKLDSQAESSRLEIEKQKSQIANLQLIFERHRYTLQDDSNAELAQEQEKIKRELESIIENREHREQLLRKKEHSQEKVDTQTKLLTTKEQELFREQTKSEQLQREITNSQKSLEELHAQLEGYFELYGLMIESGLDENYATLERQKSEFEESEANKQKIENQLQKLRLSIKEQETNQTALTHRAKEAKEEQNVTSEDIKTLKQESKTILDVEDIDLFEKESTQRYDLFNDNYNKLSKEIATRDSAINSLEEQIKTLIQKQERDSLNLTTQENDLSKALVENGFASVDTFTEALISKEQRAILTAECRAIEERYTKAETLQKTTIKNLHELKEKELSKAKLEDINKQLLELQEQIDTLQKDIGSLSKELEINASHAKKHAEKIKKLQQKKEALAVWEKLNDMIGSANGDKFAKFAQGITLDQLIYLANKHLHILSPRYELQRSLKSNKLLELEVTDSFQADAIRPVHTLSGGESFIVSLALALGLSALASQKISIDSLFLDEGFGSLDGDSLEMSLNALNALQSSGKMIGVISHVDALKERIPMQIRVVPRGDGTSRVEIQN